MNGQSYGRDGNVAREICTSSWSPLAGFVAREMLVQGGANCQNISKPRTNITWIPFLFGEKSGTISCSKNEQKRFGFIDKNPIMNIHKRDFKNIG